MFRLKQEEKNRLSSDSASALASETAQKISRHSENVDINDLFFPASPRQLSTPPPSARNKQRGKAVFILKRYALVKMSPARRLELGVGSVKFISAVFLVVTCRIT